MLLLLLGCYPDMHDAGHTGAQSPWEAEEVAIRLTLLSTPLSLSGTLLDATGAPLVGASCALGDRSAATDADGVFSFKDLPRENALLRCQADGFHPLDLPVRLLRPVSVAEVELPPVPVQPRVDGVSRFLFGGDTALGRRYLDLDEDTPRNEMPPDDPEAWIQTSDPVPGTTAIFSLIGEYFEGVDYRSLNLESPITDDPSTPHETKDYAFFTLPGSLSFIDQLGIDYVSLGNNHVYDYLEPGLEDTLYWIEGSGVGFSGMGATPAEAATPWRETLDGVEYAFFSACSIDGDEHEFGYLATDTQGGAADLNDDDLVADTIAAEDEAGRFVIAALHMGDEYIHEPTDYMLNRMELAVDAGADFVLAHHPHVAQGFGEIDGVLAAYGLGNFAFDQDRVDTMLGLLVRADLGVEGIQYVEGAPIYIEDYRPRPVTGALGAALTRRIAEYSDVDVAPYAGLAWVGPYVTTERTVTLELEIPASGFALVDLRQHMDDEESFAGLAVAGAEWAFAAPGWDILHHGTFEDDDVDGDWMEGARWDVEGSSRALCATGAMRGAVGLCSWRSSGNESPSTTSYRNRVRVWGDPSNEPNRDVTLFGYSRGENAGAIAIEVGYYASVGEAEFGGETPITMEAGSWDWTPFSAALTIPADIIAGDAPEENPRALRFFIHHEPPEDDFARASFDDLAVITWGDERLDAKNGALTEGPNTWDFLRVEAPEGAYTAEITLRAFAPAAAASR